MKAQIKLLFIASLSIWQSSVQAELSWAQTPFWRTLYQDQQIMKIIAPNLDTECRDSANYLITDDAQFFDVWRKTSDNMNSDFSAVFKIDTAATDAIVKNTLDDANQAERSSPNTDALPFYTLPVAEVDPLNGFVGAMIVPGSNSLSSHARELGLKPLTIQVNVKGPVDGTITVHGRDAVCDLYAGRATLAIDSTGRVKISIDQQLKLQAFYKQVEAANASAMSRGKSPLHRALAFGWEIGEIIYPLTHDVPSTLAYIESVVSALFDDDMSPNQVWTWTDAKSAQLQVDGNVPAHFHVILER